MYVTFAILIITAKKKLCNAKRTTSNVLKSQILDTLHILNFRLKLRWSFPMEQNAGIGSKESRQRYGGKTDGRRRDEEKQSKETAV